MKYLDLELSLPDQLLHPMQAFIRDSTAVQYEEMLAWRIRPTEETEYALYYVEGDINQYRQAVAEVPTVLDCRITPIDDSAAHVLVCEATRADTLTWRTAFADRDLIVVPPIRFDSSAAMAMTIVGAGPEINDTLDAVPPDIDVTINEIGTYDKRGGTLAATLSARQLDAVTTALHLGYYDVPRTAALHDVAATLECAESTASKLLRRAERDLLSAALNRYGGTP
jgi:hypothetical protein